MLKCFAFEPTRRWVGTSPFERYKYWVSKLIEAILDSVGIAL